MRFRNVSGAAERHAFPDCPKGPKRRYPRGGVRNPVTEREGTTPAQKSNNPLSPPGYHCEKVVRELSVSQPNPGSKGGMGTGAKAIIGVGVGLAVATVVLLLVAAGGVLRSVRLVVDKNRRYARSLKRLSFF